MLDLPFVRSHFPALESEWALFDNAGGSVPARSVIDRIHNYMSRHAVQLGATYPLSVDAANAVDQGRQVAARALGASPREVVVGPSSTNLIERLAAALRPLWKEGDEVVVTNLDHETNIGPWRRLEASGIRVREWRFREDTARLELDDLEPLLTDRTRLVAFTHCANVVGTIHDVSKMTARIRAAGALSCVDGVAYAPHRRVDVEALGVDFYIASLYKVFGPHVGVMFGRREALLAGHSVNHFFVDESEVPYKYEPGGVVHETVAGVAGIETYLEAVAAHHGLEDAWVGSFDLFAEAEAKLVAPFLAFLDAEPRVRVIGSTDSGRETRVPTVAFSIDGLHASEVATALEESRVAIRYGHFYAHRAIEAFGLQGSGGVVRASFLHYNTQEEVERLVAGLRRLLTS